MATYRCRAGSKLLLIHPTFLSVPTEYCIKGDHQRSVKTIISTYCNSSWPFNSGSLCLF